MPGEQALVVRPMGPLHSPVVEEFPQPGHVPREPLPDLGAMGSGLPRGAHKRERQLHPRQARVGVVGVGRVAVLDRSADFLLLHVPREVREVPGIVPGVASRAVAVHHALQVRNATHVVDDFEAASDVLGAQIWVFCVVLLAVGVSLCSV